MALDDARQEAAMLEMAFDLLRNLTYTSPFINTEDGDLL